MNAPLLNLNSLIKKEADKILKEKGLFSILSSFGTPHISPVYILNHFLSAYFQALNNLFNYSFFLPSTH